MLSGHLLPANAGFQLTVTGMSGMNFRIQTSGNPASGTWTDAASVTNALPVQTWTNTNTTTPSRFYRFVSP